MPDRNPELSPEDAIRALCSDYMTEVRAIAKEALAVPEDQRDDWIHQTIDGHERVIFTYKARIVLICTDNPDAHQEELGEPAPGPEQAAFCAMIADVRELLGNRYFIAASAEEL